jgi:hypothetical protein
MIWRSGSALNSGMPPRPITRCSFSGSAFFHIASPSIVDDDDRRRRPRVQIGERSSAKHGIVKTSK